MNRDADNLADVQWIAQCAHRLREQWPRADVVSIDETALELWRDRVAARDVGPRGRGALAAAVALRLRELLEAPGCPERSLKKGPRPAAPPSALALSPEGALDAGRPAPTTSHAVN